jgi:hypothetical protein
MGSFCSIFSNLSGMVSSQYNEEERVALVKQRKSAGASRK